VEALKTDVFVVLACIVFITPVVDCRVVIVPEVACKLLKEPVDTFKTEIFVFVASIVVMFALLAFKTEVFVFETNTLFIKLFTHAVVGTVELLSLIDKEEFIIGLYKKVAVVACKSMIVALLAFKTETFSVTTCNKLIVAVELFKPKVFVMVDKEFVVKLFTHAVVGTVELLSLIDKDEFIVGLYKKVA
jgi:hypothetical protein